MTYWLYPANTKFYDVFAAFKKKTVYWPMKSKVSVDDVLYFYLAAPYKQVAFRAVVKEVDLDQTSIMEKVIPFLKNEPDNAATTKPFMKLSTIKTIPVNSDSPLNLQNLKQHGLKGMLMGARNLEKNPELLEYIRNLD